MRIRKTLVLPVSSRRRTTMNTPTPEAEALLTPAEVAAMFRVDPKTVTRWAKAGKLSSRPLTAPPRPAVRGSCV
jgi:hypothetical protein